MSFGKDEDFDKKDFGYHFKELLLSGEWTPHAEVE